jgi:hypothetical protein
MIRINHSYKGPNAFSITPDITYALIRSVTRVILLSASRKLVNVKQIMKIASKRVYLPIEKTRKQSLSHRMSFNDK